MNDRTQRQPPATRQALARLLAAGVLLVHAAATAGEPGGEALYREACASCHGLDGRGASGTRIAVPLPDFSDCGFNTREPDSDWSIVVMDGGPAMGLSDQMPAFRDVLAAEQVAEILDYLRRFCREPSWPRGELNFRRPLFTSKAFPENEAVLAHRFTDGPGGDDAWLTELVYERRIGARGQAELTLPFPVEDAADAPAEGGIGDLAVGYKHVLYADLPRLTIAAASLELVVPSGDRDRGLGDGTMSVEPSLHGGAGLGSVVLQGQIQGVAPLDEGRADRGVRYRLAASHPLGPLRRDWWPTLELEVFQNVTRSEESVFLTPQVYKAVRRRGHVALALGVQVPVAGQEPFDYRIAAFLLWEYQDGGLWW
jgi:mono/diheme cytochrome c family protein